MSNMVGEGRAGYAQLSLNLTHREPFVARTYQQPNNFQSGRVTDFGENVGGVFEFHAAIIGLVNRQVNLITRNIEITIIISFTVSLIFRLQLSGACKAGSLAGCDVWDRRLR